MKLKFLVLALVTACMAANAGSMGTRTNQSKWAGFYVGGNLGAGWDILSNHLTIVNNTINPLFYPPSLQGVNHSGSNSFDPLRFIGGAQGGFNKALTPNLMVGLEISYDYLNLSQKVQNIYLYENDPIQKLYAIQNVASATQIGTLRPRLGYFLEDYLFYLTGGGAVTRVNYHQTFTDPQYALSHTTALNQVRYGWTLGGGLEYFPLDAISVKLEYLYANFGNQNITNQFIGTGSVAGLSATVHNSLNSIAIQTVLLGINWHFA